MRVCGRREFAAVLAGLAGTRGAMSRVMSKPVVRVGGPFLRLSCNAYSFNALLSSGEMSVAELLGFLAAHGFDAVDLTGYYIPGYPNPPSDDTIYRIKRQAFLLGLDISGTGVRNDFTSPEREKRAADVRHVQRWIPVAAKLGAPVIRVFAGRGVPGDRSAEEVYSWVADALQECADFGGRHGVMIVLQNHAELLKSASDVLTLLKMVDSDWIGLNLDIGSFRTPDPYDDIAKLAPHAVTWQIKEEVYFGETKVKTDLPRLLKIIREAGYRGYLPLEILGDQEPHKRLADFLKEVRSALQA